MNRLAALASMVVFTGFLLAGCTSSGSSSSAVSAGFAVPTEISAVPPSSSGSLATALTILTAAATDAGTDYSNAVTTKYVEEETLKQFKIIETILKALAQTRYADAANPSSKSTQIWKTMVALSRPGPP